RRARCRAFGIAWMIDAALSHAGYVAPALGVTAVHGTRQAVAERTGASRWKDTGQIVAAGHAARARPRARDRGASSTHGTGASPRSRASHSRGAARSRR